jgi:uncharacterized membrane protein YhaH (DUF805 family)
MTELRATPVAAVQPPLDKPLYGAGPVRAVKRFYQNYATFSGRASRSEYWWVALFFFLASGVLLGLGIALGAATSTTSYGGETQPGPGLLPFGILLLVLMLASILPGIAVTVRRLHDANYSGLLYLLTFIPYLGGLAILVLNALPSNPQGARFDAGAPAQGSPAQGSPAQRGTAV